MKKIFSILILIAVVVAALTLPVYAEVQTVPDGEKTPLSVLSYYNMTAPSGEVIRQFTLAPSDNVRLDGDGNIDLVVAVQMQTFATLLQSVINPTFSVSVQNGVISVTAVYPSLTDFYIAMGETGFGYEPPQATKTEGFFFTSYVNKITTEWSFADDENTVPGLLYGAARAFGEAEENIRFVYVYGTKYKPQAVSSDAESIQSENGLYMHRFIMTKDTIDREITIVQNNPNPVGWYIVAIAVGCVVAAVLVILGVLNRKKH